MQACSKTLLHPNTHTEDPIFLLMLEAGVFRSRTPALTKSSAPLQVAEHKAECCAWDPCIFQALS